MQNQTNQNTQQTAAIQYAAPRAVKIGDVFYRIERGNWLNFREPCPVCKGEKKLTVNGYTFDCPACDTLKTTIQIAPFLVRRYRVNGVREEADDTFWKMGNRYVFFHFYRKVGKGYVGYFGTNGGTFEMSSSDFCRQYNEEYDGGLPHAESGIYDDYNVAISIAEQMTRYELRRLADFNAKFGTHHEAAFAINHDPKSE